MKYVALADSTEPELGNPGRDLGGSRCIGGGTEDTVGRPEAVGTIQPCCPPHTKVKVEEL